MKTMSVKSSPKAPLRIMELSKSFENVTLFEDLNLCIQPHDKVVLVGENGLGKSTLFKIILGELAPDAGTVGTTGTIGHLPQNPSSVAIGTVRQYLVKMSGNPELQAWLDGMGDHPSEVWDAEYNRLGGYRFEKILAQLGLKDLRLETVFSVLSGGQKTKVVLAGLAVLEPDLLLLDEPTNHLDSHALAWLERFIKHYPGATVLISHDRALINNSANVIIELAPDNHQLVHFRGGYRDYLAEKERIYERQKQMLERQREEVKQINGKMRTQQVKGTQGSVRKDNDKIGYNARGAGKQRSQKRVLSQLHRKIDSIQSNLAEVPLHRKSIQFEWLIDGGAEVRLRASDLTMGYAQNLLFEDLSFQVGHGERVMVVGPNGCGKTTLLKILAGIIAPQKGSFSAARGVKIGYLDQEQEMLDPQITAIETCQKQCADANISVEEVHHQLKLMGLFNGTDLRQPVGLLSVGKKRKLQLASIILSGANLLLLDEPTNHIDLMSVEAIEQELLNFPGAVMAASHDRWFLKKVGTRIIKLDGAQA